MLKNFIVTIKRYSTSIVLNMIGLSIAYVAFIIILMQVTFEYGYDTYNKNVDKIYRIVYNEEGEKHTQWAQPVIDHIGTISPIIEAFTIYTDNFWDRNIYASVVRPNGGEEIFEVSISAAYQDIIDILDIEIIEGDKEVLKNPYSFMIPQSEAQKIWGKESAVGKTFTIGKNIRSVGAVYKDLPKNSVFDNFFYYSTSSEEKTQMSQWNYMFLIKISNPNNIKDLTTLINKELNTFYIEKGEYQQSEQTPTVDFQPIKGAYYATPLRLDYAHKGNSSSTVTMFAIAILILVIATINYINFASALTPFRIKMLNLQKIMGGNKTGLRCSLLFESAAISLGAFIVALFITLSLQSSNLQGRLIAGISFSDNFPLICWCAVIALITGICAGIYPAFYMTSIPPAIVLKGSFGVSPKGRRFRAFLIGIQFTISITLIIATIFINLQSRYINHFSLGFNTQRIIITKIDGKANSVKSELVGKLRQSSQIEDIAFTSSKFGGTEIYEHWQTFFDDIPVEFNLMHVTPNFLDLMEIKIAEGRNFRMEDTLLTYNTVILNHITPKKDGSPAKIGDGQRKGSSNSNYEIIGFTDNSLHTLSMRYSEAPFGFLTCTANDKWRKLEYMYIKIKPGVNMFAAKETIQKTFKEVIPAFPVEPEFMDKTVASLYVQERNTNYLVTLFSLLTIIISLVGVFGLVLFETQFRRKEIGIRRIHGASISSIIEMYNKKYLIIVVICFLIATPISYYIIGIWLSRFAYHISLYWWVFTLSLVIVLFLTAITVTIRCWKSATENPANTIKTE